MLERRTQRIQPYLLLIPSLLILTVFLLVPLLWNVYLSVHNVSLSTILRDWKYVGPNNFLELVTDPGFHSSLTVSIVFVGGSVTLQFLFGAGSCRGIESTSKRFQHPACLVHNTVDSFCSYNGLFIQVHFQR